MSDLSFRAYRVEAAKLPAELVRQSSADLPERGLTVRVTHSSLNYKDGLAMLGRPGVVRSFPLTCGIDLAGVVVDAEAGFEAGDHVLLTGAGLSETAPGGFSEYQRIDPTYVVPTPAGLGNWGAMAVGTAGLTAMLCVTRLEASGITPDRGPVLVTGATGGVGSFAVSVLAQLGYEVHASTGKEDERAYLLGLGAQEIVARDSLTSVARPLAADRWAGAVDSVGGATLAAVISHLSYSGAAASCGLAGGSGLPTTVLPFILRNVSLLGVDSVNASLEARRLAWQRLGELFTPESLGRMTVDARLEDVPGLSAKILDGQVRGRVVIDLRIE